jgi:hypothetical protein
MKTRLLTLATIAALLLTESCKKDAIPTSAQGRVTTLGTETPLAGIAVTLIEDNYGGGVLGGNGGYNGPIKTVHTDQDGYYHIDHTCNPSTAYWVEFETAEGHFGPIQKQAVYPGQNNTINMKQIPFAYVRLHIKNVNPYNVYDKFNYLLDPGGGGGFDGPGIDVITTRRTAGNGNVLLYYTAIKNGQLVVDSKDTLFIPAYDTLDYQIFY